MIFVNGRVSLREEEIGETFIRSSGPGGQNVNKVATAVELRFDAAGSPSIPDDVRPRLLALAGSRLTLGGEIVLKADRYRTLQQNREDALERLLELIRKASTVIRPRRKTRPTLASKERRITAKKTRSDVKCARRKVNRED